MLITDSWRGQLGHNFFSPNKPGILRAQSSRLAFPHHIISPHLSYLSAVHHEFHLLHTVAGAYGGGPESPWYHGGERLIDGDRLRTRR
jgi:hypothetical protein